MRFSLATFIAVQALVVSAVASTVVTLSSTPQGHYFTDVEESPLANGDLVLVGSFEESLTNAQPLPFEELAALFGWEEFGRIGVGSIGDIPGKIIGDVINGDVEESAAFAGKQIFLWVFNSPSISMATQYGIFSAVGVSLDWRFPVGNTFDQTVIDINDAMAVIGGADGDRMYLTGIIPEPGTYTAILSLLVVCVALRIKRRNAIK